MPATPAGGLIPAGDFSFSHSSSSGFVFSFSEPLVIVALEAVVMEVAPGLAMGPPGFAEVVVVVCGMGGRKGIISNSTIGGGGRGLDRTARGKKKGVRARRVEDRMMGWASMEGGREMANERNVGQRMASPGNLGNELESQRGDLVDGRPLIKKRRTVKDCELRQ